MSQEYDDQATSEQEILPEENKDTHPDLPLAIQLISLSGSLFLTSPIVAGIVGQSFPDDFLFPQHSSEVLSVLLSSAVVAREYRVEENMTARIHIGIWLQWIAVISWIAGAKEPIQSFLGQAWQGIVQQYEQVADATYDVFETGNWLAERPALLIAITASLVLLRSAINRYNNAIDNLSTSERYQYDLRHLLLLMIYLYELSETILEGSKRFIIGNPNKRNSSDNNQT